MRVMECNFCGETLAAANDDELHGVLTKHMQSEHPDEEFDEDSSAELVEQQAYTATDS